MIKKSIKTKGFFIKKNIFKKSEIFNFEKNLINFIYKITIKSHKNISKKAKIILKLNGKNFQTKAIKLLEEIELKDKDLFYKLSKYSSNILSINRIDENLKIQKILKKFFRYNYQTILRRNPVMLFNKKNLDRLKYKWHQESQFYPEHELGLHMWFPIFRDVKSKNDGGMVFAVNGHKKEYNYQEIKKKNSWTQRIPKINVEKNFQIISPSVARGDAVFFINQQLHRSDRQDNQIPRVSFVIRYLSNDFNKKLILLT
jgi:hypothetical protein